MGLLALELVGFWVDLGLSVEMEAFGRALDYKCSMELGVLWWSKGLASHLLPLGFRPDPLTVPSRIYRPHSIGEKTHRLIVKQFSTVRNTQRIYRLILREKLEEGEEGKEKKGAEGERRKR